MMNTFYYYQKRIFFQIKRRIHLILFIISLGVLFYISLNLLNIEFLILISEGSSFYFMFQLLRKISSIFILFFLPTYPIFFNMLKNKSFKVLEKISMTIVCNLSFYILIGFLGYILNLPISFEFFFFTLTLAYLIILGILIFIDYHRGYVFFLKKKSSVNVNQKFYKMNSNSPTSLSHIKKPISFNGALLIVFIILICILFIINTEFFAGTDPWLHISIIKYITKVRTIPINEYYGALGLHIYGAVIHFFSGLDIILIPKYFVFFTFPVSSLIVYNLLMRIFKNKDLAIFGVFLLVFSSLGFSYMMIQFWPSSIALIQGLMIFFVLYVRLQKFTKEKLPNKEDLLSNMLFSYFFLTILFVTSILTHSLIAMVLVISYLWIYLIYFVINYRRGFDILLLGIFLFIFSVFYYFNISTGHIRQLLPFFVLPWSYLIFGIIFFAGFELILFKHYWKSMDFTKGRFKLIVLGKKNKIYKKIEDKYLIPLLFTLILIPTLFFSIGNILIFNLEILSYFNMLDILILSAFALWGLGVFQYKPRGKPLWFWFLALSLILLVVFIFDVFFAVSAFYSRVFYITSIIIAIGFVSYLYKLIRTNSIQHVKYKFLILFIMVFSLIISFIQNSETTNTFSLKDREVSSVKWFANYTDSKQVIISEFGWEAIFVYFDYPFEDENESLTLLSIHIFKTVEYQLVHPFLHYLYGSNNLRNLKLFFLTDVILILPKEFYLPFSWQFFDQLSNEEIEAYYKLEYVNRIFSAREANGEETPYYWVI